MKRIRSRRWWTFVGFALIATHLQSQQAQAITLYISSSGNDRVLTFDDDTGAFIAEFVTAGSGGLSQPRGLTFGPDGHLYVASSDGGTNFINRYDGMTGAFLATFADGGGMDGPGDVVFGPDGTGDFFPDLYVSSFSTNNVLRFNGTTGAFVDTFASHATLSGAAAIAFGPDATGDGVPELYVASTLNGTVLQFNGATGAYIGVFASNPNLINPSGIAFGPDGHLYVTDAATTNVFKFHGLTGASLGTFASGAAFAQGGSVRVSASAGVLVAFQSGSVFEFNGETGALVRTAAVDAGLVRPAATTYGPDHLTWSAPTPFVSYANIGRTAYVAEYTTDAGPTLGWVQLLKKKSLFLRINAGPMYEVSEPFFDPLFYSAASLFPAAPLDAGYAIHPGLLPRDYKGPYPARGLVRPKANQSLLLGFAMRFNAPAIDGLEFDQAFRLTNTGATPLALTVLAYIDGTIGASGANDSVEINPPADLALPSGVPNYDHFFFIDPSGVYGYFFAGIPYLRWEIAENTALLAKMRNPNFDRLSKDAGTYPAASMGTDLAGGFEYQFSVPAKCFVNVGGPAIEVTPETVSDGGAVELGGVVENRDVRIRNHGVQPMRVTSVSLAPGGGEFAISGIALFGADGDGGADAGMPFTVQETCGSAMVRVAFSPADDAGPRAATVTATGHTIVDPGDPDGSTSPAKQFLKDTRSATITFFAMPDGGVDAGPDAGDDAGGDAGGGDVDAGGDAGEKADAGTVADADAGAGVDAGAGTESGKDAGSKIVDGGNSGVDADAGADAGATGNGSNPASNPLEKGSVAACGCETTAPSSAAGPFGLAIAFIGLTRTRRRRGQQICQKTQQKQLVA
ncbi:MAG: NHL repeat-containing protein [Deltaproteobacteria bacterium]|nr:NHL repeat-containing protein [Deltaproteobacteria bacterium]